LGTRRLSHFLEFLELGRWPISTLMKFVDEAQIQVSGGHGGAGCLSFLREKYKAKGGPTGGDGGDGGDVILQVDLSMTSLLDFKYQPLLSAKRGEHGRG